MKYLVKGRRGRETEPAKVSDGNDIYLPPSIFDEQKPVWATVYISDGV